ncbi:unnamed protein product [Camellia sinensis]
MIKWTLGEAGSIEINGTEYQLHTLLQSTPSMAEGYAMELHMVHESPQENEQAKIAVIGVFYQIGRPDPFLTQLMRNISNMIDQKDERHFGMVDPRDIKTGGKRYYRYMGSLTVPPCTEGVVWTINKRTVSREQVKLLRETVHDSKMQDHGNHSTIERFASISAGSIIEGAHNNHSSTYTEINCRYDSLAYDMRSGSIVKFCVL